MSRPGSRFGSRPEDALCRAIRPTTRTSTHTSTLEGRDPESCQVLGELLRLVAQLPRRAADDVPPPGRQPALPLLVGGPVPDVHVEGALDLQHQGAAVGEVPLAVGVALLAGRVEPWRLTAWWLQAPQPAHPGHVGLAHGPDATRDLSQRGAKQRRPPERPELVDPLMQSLRGRAPLLHCRRERPEGVSPRGLVRTPQEERGLSLVVGRSPGPCSIVRGRRVRKKRTPSIGSSCRGSLTQIVTRSRSQPRRPRSLAAVRAPTIAPGPACRTPSQRRCRASRRPVNVLTTRDERCAQRRACTWLRMRSASTPRGCS